MHAQKPFYIDVLELRRQIINVFVMSSDQRQVLGNTASYIVPAFSRVLASLTKIFDAAQSFIGYLAAKPCLHTPVRCMPVTATRY